MRGLRICDAAKAIASTNPPCSCPAPIACTPGQQRCNPATGNPETCQTGAGGCPSWVQSATCNATHQTCQVGGTGTASCVCNAAPGCSAATFGSSFCPTSGGTTVQSCTIDGASGCFYLTAPVSCPSTQQTCVAAGGNGTAGTCTCPGTSCTPGTTSCTTGTALQACIRDVPLGCGVVTNTDCPTNFGSGSICTGAPAHCTCPAPTGSTLVVDATSGDDVSGTGASSPPQCAFRSITKAMAQTGVGTTFTQISARTGTYSAATTGETFPINLKAGVTLTTATVPAAGTPYQISGSGPVNLAPRGAINATIVFTAATTATLSNFTVSAAGAASDVFACNAGRPVLSGATFTQGQRGIGIYGSCAPMLTNTTTSQNSQVGIVSASSAPTSAPVNIGNHISDRDDDGVYVRSGSVVVNMLEVRAAQGNRLGGGDGVLVVPANLGVTTPVSFVATGLNIHDGAGDGLRVDRGAGFGLTTVSVASSAIARQNGVGILLLDGSPTFTGTSSADNGNEGIDSDVDANSPGHTVTFNGGSVTGNCTAGACRGIVSRSGTFLLSGANGAPATVSSNRGVGLEHIGGNFTGSFVTFASNTNDGALIDLNNGETFRCSDCNSALNSNHGFEVRAAPAVAGFSLARGGVLSNGQAGAGGGGRHGIFIRANNGPVNAVIDSVQIGSNMAGAGVFVAGGNANVAMTNNDITGNGGLATLGGLSVPLGGVALQPGGAFTFTGNKVHGNLHHGFSVLGRGGATVSLSSGSCTNANQFYCYGAGNVGLMAYDGVAVDARNSQWNQTPPTTVDATGGTLAGGAIPGTVNLNPDCGRAASFCP